MTTRGAPPGLSDVTEAPRVRLQRGFQGWARCSRCAAGPAEAGVATYRGELTRLARHPRSVLLSRKASSTKGTDTELC